MEERHVEVFGGIMFCGSRVKVKVTVTCYVRNGKLGFYDIVKLFLKKNNAEDAITQNLERK